MNPINLIRTETGPSDDGRWDISIRCETVEILPRVSPATTIARALRRRGWSCAVRDTHVYVTAPSRELQNALGWEVLRVTGGQKNDASR